MLKTKDSQARFCFVKFFEGCNAWSACPLCSNVELSASLMGRPGIHYFYNNNQGGQYECRRNNINNGFN